MHSRSVGASLSLYLLLASVAPGLVAEPAGSPVLPRRGVAGVRFAPGEGGLSVRAVEPGGPAAQAGLEAGDLVVSLDGRALDPAAWQAEQRRLVPGRALTLSARRGARSFEARLTPVAAPLEEHDCCDVRYEAVRDGEGQLLRAIVTRPRGATGRLPAVLFVGWLSCDSIELSAAGNDGWSQMLRKLVRESGYVVMRVDKRGVGDSQGDCGRTDYLTEIDGYRAALRALRELPFVDPGAVFLFGGSMGGATAALAVQDTPVRGVAAWGTFSKTWLEHMIELERRRLALSGLDHGAVTDKLRGYVELHTLVLNRKLTPAEAARRVPELDGLWYDAPEHLYGRPLAFYQQAQAQNVLAAWEKIDAPVLSVYGEYDWIMSRDDHELIAAAVNRRRPGSARFVLVPRTDHHFVVFDSAQKAFADEGGRVSLDALDEVLRFMREVLAAPAR